MRFNSVLFKSILSTVLTLTLVAGSFSLAFADAKKPERKGWYTTPHKNKMYYVKGKPVKGLQKIGKYYYFFNNNGIMKKGTVKSGSIVYYLSDKGVLEASRTGKNYYYATGQLMTKADKKDWMTYMRAKKIVAKITTKKMSRKKKLRVCFNYVMKFPYVTYRKFYRTSDWPAVYANDHFIRKGGNCQSDAAAFAYMAKALGYKDVYVCTDSNKSLRGHSWAEVNGRVYDPLFAQAKSFKKNYGVTYKTYPLHPINKIRIPYGTPKHLKGKKQTLTSEGNKAKPIKGWDTKTKKMYYKDGTIVRGIVYHDKKFYAFNSQGVYDSQLTGKIRTAAKRGKDIEKLTALLGDPVKTGYTASCYKNNGDDGILTYKQFVVTTYRPVTGTEIFMSAKAR